MSLAAYASETKYKSSADELRPRVYMTSIFSCEQHRFQKNKKLPPHLYEINMKIVMIRVAKQWGRDRIIRFFVDLINFLSGINYANDAMHLIKIG